MRSSVRLAGEVRSIASAKLEIPQRDVALKSMFGMAESEVLRKLGTEQVTRATNRSLHYYPVRVRRACSRHVSPFL